MTSILLILSSILNTCGNVPLVNTIEYFDPLSIDWTFTPEGQPPLGCTATTKHRVYVTWGVPNQKNLFETVIDLGCRNATGLTDKSAIITAVFDEYTDLVVNRKAKDGFNVDDAMQLTYYQSWNCDSVTTAALLGVGDGQCGSWAKFFIDVLGEQGINHQNEYVVFWETINNFDRGFIVKDWDFAPGGGISRHLTYPYLNIQGNPLVLPSSYNWRFAEVTDATGIPGQGPQYPSPQNPASLFSNHQVVKIGGIYYDPSYGNTFLSLEALDVAAIEGYWIKERVPVDEPAVGLDLNGDQDMADLSVQTPSYIFRTNPVGNNLEEVLYEYPTP